MHTRLEHIEIIAWIWNWRGQNLIRSSEKKNHCVSVCFARTVLDCTCSLQVAKREPFRVFHASRGAQVKHKRGANSRRNNTVSFFFLLRLFYFTVGAAIARDWQCLLPLSKIVSFLFRWVPIFYFQSFFLVIMQCAIGMPFLISLSTVVLRFRTSQSLSHEAFIYKI